MAHTRRVRSMEVIPLAASAHGVSPELVARSVPAAPVQVSVDDRTPESDESART